MKRSTLTFLLFFGIVVCCIILGKRFEFSVEDLRTFFLKQSPWSVGFVFVLLYVVSTTFLWYGPKDVLRLFAAFFFGAYLSAFYIWIAELGNLVILFLMSRKLGRGFIVDRFSLNKKNIERLAHDEGSFLEAAALRINPLIPFRLLDLAMGLTRISLKKYFLVALIVTFPRIFWGQYILAGIGEGVLEGPGAAVEYIIANPIVFKISGGYILLVIALSTIAYLPKMVRNKLGK